MSKIRKHHSNEFKMKVALEAFRGDKGINELCQEYAVAASQIYDWKNTLLEKGHEIFANKKQSDKQSENVEKLHAVIGKLTVERDFLSRVLGR